MAGSFVGACWEVVWVEVEEFRERGESLVPGDGSKFPEMPKEQEWGDKLVIRVIILPTHCPCIGPAKKTG